LHAKHEAPQALLQQTPSKQNPDVHWTFDVHALALPSSAMQAPDPLHVPVEHSLSGLDHCAIGPQEPSLPLPFLAAAHAMQVPVHTLPQQTPSTQ
jgi:hypothetical protein